MSENMYLYNVSPRRTLALSLPQETETERTKRRQNGFNEQAALTATATACQTPASQAVGTPRKG
ncbi:hypothetical protein Dda_8591 [Drechslerella dactyloides]|uniref:Uncharacterized protein n=1 Tax=Drechslerella dactyloides TaxID=74499 RepID=A0AAD6IQP8_DREDA|nr:hypothetical protein Dda_8591 [Drechslerella dactyloides]